MREMQINLEAQKNIQQLNQPSEFGRINPNTAPNNTNYPSQEVRGNFNDNPAARSETRQEILSEYSNKFKSSMQYQFRNSFTSAGSFQPKNNLPTITYIGSKFN